MPPFGIGLAPARGPLGRWRDRVLNSLGERQWDAKGLAGLNVLRQRYGLAPLPHLFDQVRSARRHLVLTSPDFDVPATLPANVRYVGPVLDDPAWAETAWTPIAQRRRRRVRGLEDDLWVAGGAEGEFPDVPDSCR